MKTGKIFWGVALILLAVLLVLDAFHVLAPLEAVLGNISLWRLVLGICLLFVVVKFLCRARFAAIFVPLALIFMLFEENISVLCGAVTPNLVNNWTLLLVALLLSAGVKILTSAFRKRKNTNVIIDAAVSEGRNKAGGSFGHHTVYIDSASLAPNFVESSFGACEIHFQNMENYHGGGTLRVEQDFGRMEIFVPCAWKVNLCVERTFASVDERNRPADGLALEITGEVNFGSLCIIYV